MFHFNYGGLFIKNNVKVVRVKMNLTQQQLADKVGITR
ncbi:hypothetical protein EMIT0210MI2_13234 [Priestia megaterium]|jgi:putative transcriptional regulator